MTQGLRLGDGQLGRCARPEPRGKEAGPGEGAAPAASDLTAETQKGLGLQGRAPNPEIPGSLDRHGSRRDTEMREASTPGGARGGERRPPRTRAEAGTWSLPESPPGLAPPGCWRWGPCPDAASGQGGRPQAARSGCTAATSRQRREPENSVVLGPCPRRTRHVACETGCCRGGARGPAERPLARHRWPLRAGFQPEEKPWAAGMSA